MLGQLGCCHSRLLEGPWPAPARSRACTQVPPPFPEAQGPGSLLSPLRPETPGSRLSPLPSRARLRVVGRSPGSPQVTVTAGRGETPEASGSVRRPRCCRSPALWHLPQCDSWHDTGPSRPLAGTRARRPGCPVKATQGEAEARAGLWLLKPSPGGWQTEVPNSPMARTSWPRTLWEVPRERPLPPRLSPRI